MFGIILLWAALQAAVPQGSQHEAVSPQVLQHVQAGLKAKEEGNLDAAVREFQQVVALAPQLAAAHMNLGAAYYEKRDYPNAEIALAKALELKPDLIGAHAMLGVALLARGFAEKAIPHLERAEMINVLGVALLEAGRITEAVEKLQAALQKQPGDPDLLYYLGHAFGRLSGQAFDQLLAQHPNSPRARQARAENHVALGQREAAEKEFRTVLEVRPDLRGIHLALGELYLSTADFDKAESEFRAELELSPGNAAALYRLGAVLLKKGQIREARTHLERANQLKPEMPETLYEMGKAAALENDSAMAERALLRVAELEVSGPLAESAHLQLAQLYRKQGKAIEADRHMRRFRELQLSRQPRVNLSPRPIIDIALSCYFSA